MHDHILQSYTCALCVSLAATDNYVRLDCCILLKCKQHLDIISSSNISCMCTFNMSGAQIDPSKSFIALGTHAWINVAVISRCCCCCYCINVCVELTYMFTPSAIRHTHQASLHSTTSTIQYNTIQTCTITTRDNRRMHANARSDGIAG